MYFRLRHYISPDYNEYKHSRQKKEENARAQQRVSEKSERAQNEKKSLPALSHDLANCITTARNNGRDVRSIILIDQKKASAICS